MILQLLGGNPHFSKQIFWVFQEGAVIPLTRHVSPRVNDLARIFRFCGSRRAKACGAHVVVITAETASPRNIWWPAATQGGGGGTPQEAGNQVTGGGKTIKRQEEPAGSRRGHQGSRLRDQSLSMDLRNRPLTQGIWFPSDLDPHQKP